MGTLTVMLPLFAASLVTTINANDLRHIGTGFAATRGKRSIDNDFNDANNNGLLVTTDSSASNLIGNYSADFITAPDYMRNLPELSLFKRAPSGFMGMRGKKDYEYSDFVRRAQLDESLIPELLKGKKLFLNPPFRFMKGQFPKRAPSGFLGMRGKKLLLSPLAESNKRGPLGFLGMRGKKDLLDLLYENSNNYDDETLQQLYDDIQTEQNLLNDIRQNNNYQDTTDEYNKRAPSAGFFGMRGKKFYDEHLYDDNAVADSYEKRAPSGFLGMRGKKASDYFFDSLEEDKRAPMGFVGMRGKKDVSAQLEMEKRSSLAQFFGIRGKKQPMPMEFRGKFVGVRGKKADQSSLQQLEEQLGNIEMNAMKLLTSTGGADESSKVKRAPSGFVGMRGKKWPDLTSLSTN